MISVQLLYVEWNLKKNENYDCIQKTETVVQSTSARFDSIVPMFFP
jgi:hypothetical protein